VLAVDHEAAAGVVDLEAHVEAPALVAVRRPVLQDGLAAPQVGIGAAQLRGVLPGNGVEAVHIH
jgi:hypothetical protein